MDRYQDQIPQVYPWETVPYSPFPVEKKETIIENVINWKVLLEEFKKEVESAKAQDKASGVPDCADPEKAKLEERVKELEKLLESGVEFVLVKRQNLQPGKYKVAGSKLIRVFE